jgi:hypothetical protein
MSLLKSFSAAILSCIVLKVVVGLWDASSLNLISSNFEFASNRIDVVVNTYLTLNWGAVYLSTCWIHSWPAACAPYMPVHYIDLSRSDTAVLKVQKISVASIFSSSIMGVNNVTSLHSWSIDVTSLIEGILLTNAHYFTDTRYSLWSTLQSYSTVHLCLWKRGTFRESRVQALNILFVTFLQVTDANHHLWRRYDIHSSCLQIYEIARWYGDAPTTHGVSRLFLLRTM